MSKWFRLSKINTEYLERKFSDVMYKIDMEVRLDTHLIPKKDNFKYLRFVIKESGDIDDDIIYHIGAAWMNYMLAS